MSAHTRICALSALIVAAVLTCADITFGIGTGENEVPSPVRPLPLEEIINPHFTGKDCDICHAGTPREGDRNVRLKFGGDDIAMCNSCHQNESLKGDLHPVGIIPPAPGGPASVPPDLPLYQGTVTCRTCHEVFLQCRVQPSVQFENINFLRGAPYKKTVDLCFRCHNKEAYAKTNPHEQRDQAGAVLKERCLYCHQSVPDPDSSASIADVAFKTETSTFCAACHGEEEKFHPARANHIVQVPEEMAGPIEAAEKKKAVSLPLFKGEIFCGTCHNPHDQGIIKREAAAKVADEKLRLRLSASFELCVACHSEKEDLPQRETAIVIEDKELFIAETTGDIPSYHKSFLEKKCRACHSITRENPEPPVVYKMCFLADCHNASLVAERFKHGDIEQGNCLLCHSQHGSQYGAHIISDQQKLCKACHPLLTPKEETVTPETGGKEMGEDFHDWYLALFRKLLPNQEISCRYCHGEDHSAGIYEKGIASCYQCHNYTKALIKGKPGKPKNIHETLADFTENKCTFCHNPHSSPFPHLLKEEPDFYK